MRKRLVAACTAVAALGLLAAGCSSGSASSGGGSTAASSGGHVTLTYWNGFTGPDEPAVTALVNQFNESHPNITIKMSVMPWDVFYQKLLPAFAAGSGPDIAAMDTEQLPQYATKNVFLPLTSYYADPANDTSSLVPAAAASEVNGTQYGVPANFAPLMLYWNKQLFAAAHISGPPQNWAQWQSDVVSMSVNAKDSPAQVSAAETFLTWWNSKSSQVYYAVHTGFVPTTTSVTAADLAANPDVAQFESVSSKAQAYNLGTQYTNIETNTWEPAIEKILQGANVASTLDGANTQVNSYLGG